MKNRAVGNLSLVEHRLEGLFPDLDRARRQAHLIPKDILLVVARPGADRDGAFAVRAPERAGATDGMLDTTWNAARPDGMLSAKSFSDAASAAARSTGVRRSRQSFTSLI